METELGEDVYRWEHGHLWTETYSDNVQALRANPTLYQNVKELCRLRRRADDLARNSSGRETLSSNYSVVAGIPSRSVRMASR